MSAQPSPTRQPLSGLSPCRRATSCQVRPWELRFEAGNPDNPPSHERWPPTWERRVDAAEEESAVTCVACGRPRDQVDFEGWTHTLCPECSEARRSGRPLAG
jgi:hypothetical protein